ncbi:MAG TPA: hypothetical protein VGH11_17525 [Jatrophihabitans sp.]|jgi:hypothetical protein
MTEQATSAAPEEPAETAGRPQTVNYGLLAIVAQCFFSVLLAFAFYGTRGYVIKGWRTDGQHNGWSDQQLHDGFPGAVRASIISAVIVVLLVLLIAKFIRDGKNWARWLYAVLVVVPISPLSEVARMVLVGFGGDAPGILRVPAVLGGLSAIAAVVLLFLKPSKPYFRRAGTKTPVRQALFPSRATMMEKYRGQTAARSSEAAGSGKADLTKKPAAARDGASVNSSTAPSAGAPNVNRPRAKSRKVAE